MIYSSSSTTTATVQQCYCSAWYSFTRLSLRSGAFSEILNDYTTREDIFSVFNLYQVSPSLKLLSSESDFSPHESTGSILGYSSSLCQYLVYPTGSFLSRRIIHTSQASALHGVAKAGGATTARNVSMCLSAHHTHSYFQMIFYHILRRASIYDEPTSSTSRGVRSDKPGRIESMPFFVFIF